MPVGAMIFLGIVLVVFSALDIIMLVSLSNPGDERNQIIVWKASSFTLLATVGAMVLDVIENYVRSLPMTANPFIQLEVAAIIYFAALVYYKRKHGGSYGKYNQKEEKGIRAVPRRIGKKMRRFPPDSKCD